MLDKQPDPGKECQDGLHFLVEAIGMGSEGAAKDIEPIGTIRQVAMTFFDFLAGLVNQL